MISPLKDEQKCFACGKLNKYGLHLEFSRIDHNTLRTTFTPLDHHQGWANYMHGGLISTILDEVMVRLPLESGLRVMTAEMTVRFEAAITVGTPLVAETKIIDRNKRLIRAEAILISPDRKKQYASATAKLIPVR